jgi:hypothetical protein
MFDVTAEETIRLAASAGLTLILLQLDPQGGLLGRPGVSWTCLAFIRSDS